MALRPNFKFMASAAPYERYSAVYNLTQRSALSYVRGALVSERASKPRAVMAS